MLICRFPIGIVQKLYKFPEIFDEEAEKNLQTFLDNPRKFRVKNSELILRGMQLQVQLYRNLPFSTFKYIYLQLSTIIVRPCPNTD
jgi:hypothetical protein